MITILDESQTGLNITTETDICQVIANETILLYALIIFRNISGASGNYIINSYIDDVPILPKTTIIVDAGNSAFRIQSQHVLLRLSSTFKVSVTGLGGDTAVDTQVLLVDGSPLTSEQVADETIPIITDSITNTIKNSIDNLTLDVHPKTTILGPCKRQPVRSTLLPKKC